MVIVSGQGASKIGVNTMGVSDKTLGGRLVPINIHPAAEWSVSLAGGVKVGLFPVLTVCNRLPGQPAWRTTPSTSASSPHPCR